jgi:hypothetical protein
MDGSLKCITIPYPNILIDLIPQTINSMQEMENAMHFQHITFINIKQELHKISIHLLLEDQRWQCA